MRQGDALSVVETRCVTPIARFARLACAGVATIVVMASCTSSAATSRITEVNNPTDAAAAARGSDPREGLEPGQSGGEDPTDATTGSTNEDLRSGLRGGQSGGEDPAGTAESQALELIFEQYPPLRRFSGIFSSTYTVEYRTVPSFVPRLRIVNDPPYQSVYTRWTSGRETWTLYRSSSMIKDCETSIGVWQCEDRFETIALGVPGALNISKLPELRLHAALFAGMAVTGGLTESGRHTVLGETVTCFNTVVPVGDVCVNDLGLVLFVTWDLGQELIWEAVSFSKTADPSAFVAPA